MEERIFSYSTSVATVLTVYGIETATNIGFAEKNIMSCNSTYRLRY